MQHETALYLVEKARSLGATLAGIVRVSELKGAPSARASEMDETWLRDDQSILVLALAHSIDEPELDWWGTKNATLGNHRLKMISEELKLLAAKEFEIESQVLKYQPGTLGIYLKDAAVLAGLGVMGANNLLITPQYGPRLRLRGLLLEAELPTTQALPFLPCESCDRRCWRACPQQAFGSGSFDRQKCRVQMNQDEANGTAMETAEGKVVTQIKYCRACELACLAGDLSA
jgi:epoxyqueuosine reductase